MSAAMQAAIAKRTPPDAKGGQATAASAMKRKRTRLTDEQEREFEYLLGRKLTDEERTAFEGYPEGMTELILGAIRAQNRPYEAWEAQLIKRFTLEEQLDSLHEQQLKRESGLRAEAEKNKREAGRDREHYLDIARQLCEQDPSLRRATPHRLAQLVRAELKKQRRVSARTGKPVSVRTIERALAKKV
jgi:hypothetical protein